MVTGEPDGSQRIKHYNYPFPADFDVLTESDTGLGIGNALTKVWSVADWGANKDIYVFGVLVTAWDENEFNARHQNCFYMVMGRTSDGGAFWKKQVTINPYYSDADEVWLLDASYYIPVPARVASDDSFRISLSNFSGGVLSFVGFTAVFFLEDTKV